MGGVLSGALATGARITVIPAVGLIMLILLGDLLHRKKYKRFISACALSAVAYLVGWERYFLNFIYYGNFFERVDAGNESLNPGLHRFIESLKCFMKDIVYGENIYTHRGVMWALNADAGILGVFILAGSLFGLLWLLWRIVYKRGWLKKYWREFGCVLAVFFGIVFMLCSTDYYAWSFRYYAPFLICILCGLLYLLKYVGSQRIVCACWGITLVLGTINAYSTISMTQVCGEVTGDTWENMLKKSEISRRFAFHEYLVENPEGKDDINDFYGSIRENKKILICNNIAQTISWCWGDNASNVVSLCLPEEFGEYYQSEDWDAVVVTKIVAVDTSVISKDLYKCFTPYGLEFNVYVKVEMYQNCFLAEEYAETVEAKGVYAFDGDYCWLNTEAEIPIKIDASNGVKIKYAAGVDLEAIEEGETPRIDFYVDGKLFGGMDVPYTGDYEVYIPGDFFEKSIDYHVFKICTNAVIGEYHTDGNNLCIRLSEISPAQMEAE